MRKYLTQNQGTISIGAFIIGMILLVLFISSITLFLNHYHIILSHLDSIKAYYLAESAVDEGVYYCSTILEEIIYIYLKDLKAYKKIYIQSVAKDSSIDYNPPALKEYLYKNFIPQIQSYKKNKLKPFKNYELDHSYETNILWEDSKEIPCIFIDGLGIYRRAKKHIKAVVLLPTEEIIGKDLNGLPIIKIHPLEIKDYFQSY